MQIELNQNKEMKNARFALLLIDTAANYSKIGLQMPFEQTPQHGIKSLGLQATPSGRQAKDPALAPKVDGVKKAPAAINNAPTNFNNEVFFISFLLPTIKLSLNDARTVLWPYAQQTRLSH
ncbi:MAG TPA: hypothetical protein VJ810_09330 [Blastocatellia bacterium]|nr:hypothetical protein [Blastocatellia bacterium]